ncbi:tetratricopeptide repeat protein [uncultured Brachyspira sp.]|uniref:tetratricopeptide repeat protein n=1 Tax=uncultured Brachyspira sp. TaxID=221953 RepID=UPI002616E825|nr:tetratricopeptide repeat protein [uncultured Brachyspira sp.]
MIKYNINNSSYPIPETKEEFIKAAMKKGKKDMYIVSFKKGIYKKQKISLYNETLKIESDKTTVDDEELKKIIKNSFFENGAFIRLIKYKIDLIEKEICELPNLKEYIKDKLYDSLRTKLHKDEYKGILNPYKMDEENALYCYHHFIILDEIARLLSGKSIAEIENIIFDLKKIEEEIKEKISFAEEKQDAGNHEEALEDIDKALELDNESAEAHYIKGVSNFNLKKFESALEDFSKAFELGYSENNIYIFKGKCLYNLERFKEALEVLYEALKLNNEDSEIYCFIGMCYYKLNDKENAFNNLNKSIELKTENPAAFYYRACCYYSNKKDIDAFDDLSEAIRLDSKYSNAYLKIAVIALNRNDVKYAIDNIYKGLYGADDYEAVKELIDILFNDFDLHRVTLYHLLGVYGKHNESSIYLLNKMILYFLKMSYLKNYTSLYNKDSNNLFSYNRSDYDIESNISFKIQKIIESLDEKVYEDHKLLFNICRFYFVYYKERNDKERFKNIKKYFDKAINLFEDDKEKSLIYYYLGNRCFYQFREAAEYMEKALNLYSDNSIYKCSLLSIFQSILPMPQEWIEKIKEYLNTDNFSYKNYLCFIIEIFIYREYKIGNTEDFKNIITSLHNEYRAVIDINIDIDYVNSNIKLFNKDYRISDDIIERHFMFSYEALFILSNEDCNTYNMKVKYLIESGKFFLRISKYDKSIKYFNEALDNIECRIKYYEKILKDIEADGKYYHGIKHKDYKKILEDLLKNLNDYKNECLYYSAIIKYKDEKYDEALSLFQGIDNFQYCSIYISLLYYEIGDNEKYIESVNNIQEDYHIKSYSKYLYTNNNASKEESIHLIASFTKMAQFLLIDNLKEKSLKYYNLALDKCNEFLDNSNIFYYMKGMIKYLIFELDINREDILEEAFEYLKKGYNAENELKRIFTEAINWHKDIFIKDMYREKADNMLRKCLYEEALEFYYKALYIKYEEEILIYIGICQCSIENYDDGFRLFSEDLKVNENSYKGYIYLAKYQYNKYRKTNDNSLKEYILYNIDTAYSKASDSDKNILDEIKQYYKYELNNSVSNIIEYIEMLCSIYINLTEYYKKENNIIMSALFIDIDYLHNKIVSLCSNKKLGNERFYFLAMIDCCFYSLTREKKDNVINSLEKLFENYNGESCIKDNINSLEKIEKLYLRSIYEDILDKNFKEGLYEKTIKIAASITELLKSESIIYSYDFKEYEAKSLYELGKYEEALNCFENSGSPSDIYKYLCYIRLGNFYEAQKVFSNKLINFGEQWRDYDYIKEKLRDILNSGSKDQKEYVRKFLNKTDIVI